MLAVRKADDEMPVYMGSDLHISQGMEVSNWEVTAAMVNATLRLPRKTSGNILMKLPGAEWEITVNDQPVEGKQLGAGVVEIPVQVDGFAHLELR